MSERRQYIVIAAGGTGGHIFPAFSLIKQIMGREQKCEILWIGTGRSREGELAARLNIPLVKLKSAGFKREISLYNLGSLMSMAAGFFRMTLSFIVNRPSSVVGFGGYVSAPVLLAAKLLRITYYLHEQNSVPGMVNRFFSNGAKLSFLGFPLDKSPIGLKGEKLLTGTPVREPLGSYEDYPYPEKISGKTGRLLICGGSQGAASMNREILYYIKKLAKKGVCVVWQTGVFTYDTIKQELSDLENVLVQKSFEDLYPYYAWSDLIICRSGASTVSEIALFKKPCILIPLPWSAEDHQRFNAEYVEECGWGISVKQDEGCGKRVFEKVDEFIGNPEMLRAMGDKASGFAGADSAAVMTDHILKGLDI